MVAVHANSRLPDQSQRVVRIEGPTYRPNDGAYYVIRLEDGTVRETKDMKAALIEEGDYVKIDNTGFFGDKWTVEKIFSKAEVAKLRTEFKRKQNQ